jgi:signal transduction histidine kinase/CheY-like chemotaxis protein
MSDSTPVPTIPTLSAKVSPAQSDAKGTIGSETTAELVQIAFRRLWIGAWIWVFGILAFAILIRDEPFTIVFLCWLGFMAATVGWAFWLERRFQQIKPPPVEDPRWALRLCLAATAGAFGWGATPWLFPNLITTAELLGAHLLLLVGLCLASMRMLLPLRQGSLAYLGAMLGPLIVHSLIHGGTPQLQLAVFILLFAVCVYSTTRCHHRTLVEAITSRFERDALAAESQAETARRAAQEAEFQAAREQAAAASQEKSGFLVSISHEIRTPINGVLGMLRIMRDTELGPAHYGYIKLALDSAEALTVLLSDVRDFALLEANQLKLEHAPYSPAAVARAVVDSHQSRARDKILKLELTLADDLPASVIGDAARIGQILGYLCANAIKFTEHGGIVLQVECTERSPQRVTLQFTVSDTGIGIDPTTLGHLFQPPGYTDRSTNGQHVSPGLALALSQRLTQAMGGSLEVQSLVDRGTTFILSLPSELPATTPPAKLVRAAQPIAAPPRLRGRVLVVEDDSVNQQVVEMLLKKLSVEVKIVADGESAVGAATSAVFDLVLMDCQLPGIDGMEATRQIRARLSGRPLKIVALTANANANIRASCQAAGMDDFLAKPVRFQPLADMLQRHLPGG